jgi:hypothetical protein
MNYHWYDFVGNLGVALILLAYFLLQINRLKSETLLYGLLNAFGAFFILISLYFDFNLSAFIIESFWLLFSFIGIVKSVKNKKSISNVQKRAAKGD